MLVQKVGPTTEPVSVVEAKSFLRVLGNEDDLLIASIIKASREYAEQITGSQFMEATFELYTEKFEDDFKLPKNPIKSIESIEYMDDNENYQVLDNSTYYFYEEFGISKIKYKTFPDVSTIEHKKAIRITFKSGFESVPESIKAWIKVKVSTLYENREQFVIGASITSFDDKFVDCLLNPYKIKEF